ncbi:MAG: hypothetical protein QOH96_2185 [Blastocatellia bacterium]|jgi:uncharacterized NAD(P)/FAD-binding protein YdhS|nr:hypothetical protein [Blastocatellia bacterium]
MLSNDNFECTVAIVGSGFSGTLVATHLLTNPKSKSLRVVLIERAATRFARGVAYGTHCFSHLLNVPAGRMSAFIEDKQHFLRWAERHALNVREDDFAPRLIYGAYLADVLNEAEAAAPHGTSLRRLTDDVVSLDVLENEAGAALKLRSGRVLHAERVVLAPGNYPPADPRIANPGFYSSKRYLRDPWAEGALDSIAPTEPVLLIGTGLTMVDISLALRERGHNAPIHALSRHGLLPQVHRQVPVKASFQFLLKSPITLRRLLRAVRNEVRDVTDSGYDWRAVLDSLRPIAQDLWRILTYEERKRFLRHVRHYWEAHRHRMAPQVAAQITRMIDSGQLKIHTGRVQDYREEGAMVSVLFRNRLTPTDLTLRVGSVINCTGPDCDVRTINDPLMRQLREQGYIRPDPLGLGLDVAADGALINANGETSGTLYTVGALRKGNLWETTAVPEIRAQCTSLAQLLADSPRRELRRLRFA